MSQPANLLPAGPASYYGASSSLDYFTLHPNLLFWKAAENGSSPWVFAPTYKMQKNLLAPILDSAQIQMLQPFRK